LFSGIELHSSVQTEPGGTASSERDTRTSYALELELKVKIPKPNSDFHEISRLNDKLPATLPALEKMLATARISPFYEDLYRLKIGSLQRNLSRLDQLLSRHNFFD